MGVGSVLHPAAGTWGSHLYPAGCTDRPPDREERRAIRSDMEVCEDMTVDLEVVNVRKRQCVNGVLDHPNSKRTCHGLESFTNGGGVLLDQLNKCDMVRWQMEVSGNTRASVNGFVPIEGVPQDCMPQQNPQNSLSPQLCQRCIAGESGHISHIPRL